MWEEAKSIIRQNCEFGEYGTARDWAWAGRASPAVVLSPGIYNEKVELAIFCPVTNQIKGYPFEVLMPDGLPVSGAILADQIKSLDWRTWMQNWYVPYHLG